MSYIEDMIKQLKEAGLQDGKTAAVPKPPIAGGAPAQHGAGVTIEKMKGHKGEEKQGVEYTKLKERITKYKVGVAGKMTLGVAAETLDTPTIKDRAKKKYGKEIFSANIVPNFTEMVRLPASAAAPRSYAERQANYDNYSPDPGADDDAPLVASAEAQRALWDSKALIWVCVPVDKHDAKQSVFYSHVCRPKAFHHSSLAIGREVLGAGEWIVESGKLMKISANSGHYQPSITSLHQCVMALSPALQPETTVFLWNRRSLRWEDVPVNDFIKDPTGGNIYKPTYDAP
jgi:hypothetical protein